MINVLMTQTADGESPDFFHSVLNLMPYAVAIVTWLLPAIIANKRDHPRRIAIYYLTGLLGWTGIGWIIAMIWACRTPKPKADRPIAEGLKLDDVDGKSA